MAAAPEAQPLQPVQSRPQEATLTPAHPIVAPQPPPRREPVPPPEFRARESEPAIEVRIGRIEVRAPRPPEQPPPPAPAVAPERGFADFALSRRGLDRSWY